MAVKKDVGERVKPQRQTSRLTPSWRRWPDLLLSDWGFIIVVALVALVMSWQFLVDASRAVPAFDAAWYQWRAEYIQSNDPSGIITIRGVDGALSGGYRVAEPVLAALLRTVGGVAEGTPTVLLSVLFRVLAAAGLAGFVWLHRRDRLLALVTLVAALPIFLLQRFFGFLDNFFALAMMAGVLLLLEPMRRSWVARVAATAFLYLGGMTHPTTLALFLLSLGAVAGWRLLRERSIRAVLRSEGPVILAGTAAVLLMVLSWMGGLWGPAAGLGEAAVPPPQPVSYFLERSISVLSNLIPAVFVPLLLVGLVHLVREAFRRQEWFAEITLAWTLPLVGMFGFALGAAYPYFRFFNATLAPIVVTAVGIVVLARAPRRLSGAQRRVAAVAVPLAIVAFLGLWWVRGLSMWNSTGSWLSPEVREQMAAARAYVDAEGEGRTAVFVVDAQPDPEIVPYGEYKEYTNGVYAGLGGNLFPRSFVFFGRVEDALAGRPTTLGDPQYDELSSGASTEALQALDRNAGDTMVLLPLVFNTYSTNQEFAEGCAECVRLSESGLFLVPAQSGAPPSDDAVALARGAAAEAASFNADPPGPLSGIAGTVLNTIRLALLLALPGWLLYRRIPGLGIVEGLSLGPLLSIAAITVAGVAAVAVVRAPLTPAVGWVAWGIATVVALVVWAAGRRRSIA